MIRAFVAIELDPNLRSALAQLQTRLKSSIPRLLPPGARIQWVRPDSIHLTLKFLGDTDEARLGDIERALALVGASQTRFSLDVGALGVFPDLRAPRVLWVGLSSQKEDQGHAHASNQLVRLAGDVDQAMATLGYPTENRPFSPHLTLARVKEHAREVGKALADSGAMQHPQSLGTLPVHAIALMKSELKPSGAVYTRLCEVPLKEATADC